MVKLPDIFGEVNKVPLSSYKNIITTYVQTVSKLKQVKSIIQMGSFSTPGLSDIDLIVVLDENQEFPKWEEISLKIITKGLPDTEVIAHDIFLIPQSIAERAEAYFYIDKQVVLYGEKIGGNFSTEEEKQYKTLLAVDYAIFTLEVITSLLLMPKVHILKMALLISTMRHSLTLSFKHELITESEKINLVDRIELFRKSVIDKKYEEKEIKALVIIFVKLLGSTISHLCKELSLLDLHKVQSLQKNSKSVFGAIKSDVNFENYFFKAIAKQQKQKWAKYFKIIPIPQEGVIHILTYFKENRDLLIDLYPFLGKVKLPKRGNEITTKSRRTRIGVVLSHWLFLEKGAFKLASGVAYIGLYQPEPKGLKVRLRHFLLKIHYFFYRL